MISVGFKGFGIYVPTKVLTNFDIEKIVDTTDEWIRARTGISERHIAAPNELTSDLATKAAVNALKDAKLKPEDVDLCENIMFNFTHCGTDSMFDRFGRRSSVAY